MSDPIMDEPAACLARVPLFPLPHGALLPGELLPLHIFEPRYRRMLEVVRAGDRLVAIATQIRNCDGGDSVVADVVGVGRIVRDRPNDDGTSDIVLHGVARGEIVREVEGEAFRRAEVMISSGSDGHPAEQYRLRRRLLLALAGRLRTRAFRYDVTAGFDPGALADRIAGSLELQPDERVAMLQAVDVVRRIEALLEILESGGHRKRLLDVVPSLHGFGLGLDNHPGRTRAP